MPLRKYRSGIMVFTMRSRIRSLHLTTGTKVSLVLLIVFPVLGLVLHGLASTIAWIAFLIVIGSFIGPSISPQTSVWEGEYKNRRLH